MVQAGGAPYREPSVVQGALDGVIARTLLWAVPFWVRPNHVTILRLVLVPIVFVLLRAGHIGLGMAVFVVAVCTDFIDGAMARTRDQITGLGINLDPVADKLLVGAVLLALGSDRAVIRVLLALMLLEIVFVTVGTVLWMRGAEATPANIFGKIKMVLLSLGLTLFLVGRLAGAESIVDIAVVILWAALVFALLSPVKFALIARDARRSRAG
ncbi:MAG: CDP-alcohol phosphatidyltransferase family protein [Thermoleophilia bacterium]|nr:CDP-alcohol phosphatidyltransferase family protein [Thermoleophilia bacterium]